MTPRDSNDLLAAHELFFRALFRTMSEEQRVLLLAHLQNLVEAQHEPSQELEEFVDRMGVLSHELARKASGGMTSCRREPRVGVQREHVELIQPPA